ncbi:MAG: hypothetical protein AB4050_10070 [Synechococcus sp.]
MQGFDDEHKLQASSLSLRNHLALCLVVLHVPLSYRDIEKMMLYRRIDVTYEAIRYWCLKFAQAYANQLRR